MTKINYNDSNSNHSVNSNSNSNGVAAVTCRAHSATSHLRAASPDQISIISSIGSISISVCIYIYTHT